MDKRAVDPVVARQFGVKRGHSSVALSTQYGVAVDHCENLDLFARPFHHRCPDEHRMERAIEPVDIDVGLETVDLGAVAVAAHVEVDRTQSVLIGSAIEDARRQQDQPSACAKHREATIDSLAQRIDQAASVEQHRHGGGFTARDYQSIDLIELRAGAHLSGLHAEAFKNSRVSGERALQGEHTEDRAYQPRSASLVSSAPISRPFMAAPRPVLTLAMMAGSWKWVAASTMAEAILAGCELLKMPDPTKTD